MNAEEWTYAFWQSPYVTHPLASLDSNARTDKRNPPPPRPSSTHRSSAGLSGSVIAFESHPCGKTDIIGELDGK